MISTFSQRVTHPSYLYIYTISNAQRRGSPSSFKVSQSNRELYTTRHWSPLFFFSRSTISSSDSSATRLGRPNLSAFLSSRHKLSCRLHTFTNISRRTDSVYSSAKKLLVSQDLCVCYSPAFRTLTRQFFLALGIKYPLSTWLGRQSTQRVFRSHYPLYTAFAWDDLF